MKRCSASPQTPVLLETHHQIVKCLLKFTRWAGSSAVGVFCSCRLTGQSIGVCLMFGFQAIQFSQTVLIQTIQFRISIVFVYTQLSSSNAGALGNAEYPFIAIATRSILSRSGST